MARHKGSDYFGFRNLKKLDDFKTFKNVTGADNSQQLLRPLPFERRFRPTLNTKNYSPEAEYNYASLWTRWRRGYELSMYANQAYEGLTYSFKYFINRVNTGIFVPGIAFMYPSSQTDMRMYMVGIRPRGSFNFLDFGYAISAVTQYDATTIAVKLNSRFGAPISFFTGEVVSNIYNANGTQKTYGFNNYTVVAVGFNNVPLTPTFAPIFNTLFLSTSAENSWSVVDATTLTIPASGPPLVGEYLQTEMRYGCTCPDFLARESFNLYKRTQKGQYPITQALNVTPGIYYNGSNSPTNLGSKDNPGAVRDFGVIYLNQIYDIPTSSEASFSDPNLYYHQPKWCKHIYAAMWDMQIKYNQGDFTKPWLVQPTDEPLNEHYREMFDRNLKKELDFLKRERNLSWWQRQSPAKDNMPVHMMYEDMQNLMVKVMNAGGSGTGGPLSVNNFEMFTVPEFNPFDPDAYQRLIIDGGTYSSGVLVTQPVNIILGGLYASGIVSPTFIPSGTINGGTY